MESARFTVSLGVETAVAVQYRWLAPPYPWGEEPWGRAARDSHVWGRLPALSGLGRYGERPHLPQPPSEPTSVPAVPEIREELQILDGALSWSPHSCLGDTQMWKGTYRRRLASETETFYQMCLAPHWREIEDRAQADIDRRAGVMAREGLGRTLTSLHPTVTYRDQTLHIPGQADLDINCDQPITLVPATLAQRCYLVERPYSRPGLRLVYPALRRDSVSDEADDGLGEVLGLTRLRLLRALDRPRTTTDLAAELHLTPSTVSYHLARLLHAGLVTRVRHGHQVCYQRSPRANLLAHDIARRFA
ncbi:ArsR/SmtB family transcription factor [Nonomuraea helvata]|uniref:ArsR/SmtB family transcription factor n=1 Tax=Nonomuraea helvata TaxID=37484 RepID=A0ABV5SCV6_9ACTN